MTDAHRSVDIYLQNKLQYTQTLLQKGQSQLSHGKWNDSLTPPNIVYPGTAEHFAAQSDGFATGTQGYIVYEASPLGSVKLSFDDPWDGANSFDVNVHGDHLVVSYDNPPAHGDNVDWHVGADRTPVIQFTLVNNISDSLITLTDLHVTNGAWIDQPPGTLNPGHSQTFALDPRPTGGFYTQISGYMQYVCREGIWKISFDATLFLGMMLTKGSCSAPTDSSPWGGPSTSTQPDDTSDLPGGSLAWRCTAR